MAYSNHTTNYNLPQYVGTDKPSYLNDFNGAMNTIDGQMKTNANGVSANSGNIGTLSNLNTTSKTDLVSAINEVNSKTSGVGDLTQLATSVKTDCVSAINEVDGDIETLSTSVGSLTNLDTSSKTSIVSAINETYGKVNLTSHLTFDKNTTGVSATGCTWYGGEINVALNSDKSVFKIYASLHLTNSSTTSPYITLPAGTFATSDADYDINPTGFSLNEGNPTVISNSYVTIKQDGSAIIHVAYQPTNSTIYVYLFPCLYFAEDFGD